MDASGEKENLEKRWKTLATLVELYEEGSESSCWGPDRAERLLREQSDPDELRRMGVGPAVIAQIFGAGAEQGEPPLPAESPLPVASATRSAGVFAVRVEARFESAHFLRSYRGITEPLHGHSYRVEAELLRVSGGLDQDELAVDFVEARRQLESIAARLDYGCINEIEPFTRLNPTAENIARWFHEELSSAMKSASARVSEIHLWEGPVNSVVFRPAPDPRV
jgi:6-pyruvoyltetrahydropterin/6-carboxytetrahydropterin synthase